MPVIDHSELRRIGRRVFIAAGSSEEEAGIVVDHLVEANLKGHDSHGVGMIPSYLRNLGNGKAAANEKGRVVTDSGAFIVYDGARGYGQIVAREATQLGIARAKENRRRGRRAAQRTSYRPRRHLWRDVRGRGAGLDLVC